MTLLSSLIKYCKNLFAGAKQKERPGTSSSQSETQKRPKPETVNAAKRKSP